MMRRRTQAVLVFTLALALLTAARATASGHLHLPWFAITGGGDNSSGAQFDLFGSMGQPAAGTDLKGGNFVLRGGFVAGLAAATASPTATPTTTPTATATAMPTATPSLTITLTPTPTRTQTPTPTATASATRTPTPSPTPTLGPTATATPTVPLQDWQWEAEAGTLTPPMATAPDDEASACVYVGTAEHFSDTAAASFSVQINDEGDYYLWARVMGLSHAENSLFLQIDDRPILEFHFPEPFNIWLWARAHDQSTIDLIPHHFSPGAHTITFRGRERNSRLDAVLLTNDRDDTPAMPLTPCIDGNTPTPTPTITPTRTPTPSPSPIPTATATATPSPTPTPSPSPTGTPSPTPSPTGTATVSPAATSSPTPARFPLYLPVVLR